MAEEQVTVWERPDRGTRGPAPERSRAQLAAAAVRLADAGGLAGLSVRRLARELGTGPASLYRYVAGRDDLLDLMVDAVTGEIDLPPHTGDPVADLVALALSGRDLHLRHPWLLDVPPEPLRTGPHGLDYLEHALAALAPATHLTGQAKLETVALVSALVALFARTEIQGRGSPTERQTAQAAYLTGAARRGDRPFLAEALAGQPAANPLQTPAEVFERLVRRVLAGVVQESGGGPHLPSPPGDP